MYKQLVTRVPKDRDLPERAWKIDVLTRFLDGSIYDVLKYEFHQERDHQGEYIPMCERAPSVRYGILKTVVNDSVSFLFAEGRFPAISCEKDDVAEATLQRIVKSSKLNAVMLDAATRGSVGSVVIWVRVLSRRLFFKALTTTFLTPTFRDDAPDTLARVRERYKVKGIALRESGYAIADEDTTKDFWFQREWDDQEERWYLPWLVSATDVIPRIDAKNSVVHRLGFVPMVWVTNLPGGDDVDGACTFRDAIEDSIEINYQLSQAGRGLKYSSSPMLLMKDDGPEQKTSHIAGDAIIVPTDGDAKMLEISGDAATAVIEYVREIRKLALETVGGSRADSDKLSAATSGRAMEMMCQPLINLADKLRASYGEGALLDVLRMVARLTRQIALVDSDGEPIRPIAHTTKIRLIWPCFFAPTSDDRQADAIAITTLYEARVMSQRTAARAVAASYDIDDIDAEIARIEAATPPSALAPVPAAAAF